MNVTIEMDVTCLHFNVDNIIINKIGFLSMAKDDKRTSIFVLRADTCGVAGVGDDCWTTETMCPFCGSCQAPI